MHYFNVNIHRCPKDSKYLQL